MNKSPTMMRLGNKSRGEQLWQTEGRQRDHLRDNRKQLKSNNWGTTVANWLTIETKLGDNRDQLRDNNRDRPRDTNINDSLQRPNERKTKTNWRAKDDSPGTAETDPRTTKTNRGTTNVSYSAGETRETNQRTTKSKWGTTQPLRDNKD